MKPLTAEEIAELRRLEGKATEAPWREEEGEAALCSPDHRVVFAADMDDADRQFIAVARNALLRLLDEVERSRALLKRIEWVDDDGMDRCPACTGYPPAWAPQGMIYGHAADCELAALLPR
jgi:uncharacterized protein with PIN domain